MKNYSYFVYSILSFFGFLIIVSCQSKDSSGSLKKDENIIQDMEEVLSLPERDAKSRLIYAPVYTHINYRDQKRRFNLSAVLSIRNTDLSTTLIINSVSYYDNDGKLLQVFLDSPLELQPMASTDYFVPSTDEGGLGANFLVEWSSNEAINEPLIQTVMIGTGGNQGISFVCEGVEIRKP